MSVIDSAGLRRFNNRSAMKKRREPELRRAGIWGLMIVVFVTIALPYAQGASPCAPTLPRPESVPASGWAHPQPESSALPPSPECGADTHTSFSWAMSCAFCGATLLPSKLLPPAATPELRLSPLESPKHPQSMPSLPWRPPA